MLAFLIILVYLACLIPLAVYLARRAKEKQNPKWFQSLVVGFSLGGPAILTLGLYCFWPYIDYLWFKDLGYDQVFWKSYWTKMALFWGSFFAILLISAVNVGIIRKSISENKELPRKAKETMGRFRNSDRTWEERRRVESIERWQGTDVSVAIFSSMVGLAMATIYAYIVSGFWEGVLLWANGAPVGVTDPIFNQDLGFYMFSLPFLNFLASSIFWLLIVVLFGTAAIYAVYRRRADEFYYEEDVNTIQGRWITHSVILVIGIFGVLIWMRFLEFYNLLFVSKAAFYGAGNAEINATMPANWVFIGIIAAVIIILIAWFFLKKRAMLYLVGLVPIAWFLVAGIFPAVFHNVYIKASEFLKEQQYISYNIEFTRQAFGLDKIEEREPEISDTLTPAQIADNKLTLDNVRIWDWRALEASYQQKQIFRQYYHFAAIDIDRYFINGKYRQVMLSARELDQARLNPSSQNWINQHLVYTHGYGLTLSPVNEAVGDGEPVFMARDIPPVSDIPEIKITQPEIYFGELTYEHVFVKTTEKEFDYPMGDKNVYTTYQGTGGVEIGTGLRRLAFATRFDGLNILISNNLNPDSKILYYRQVDERLNMIAPFLLYDQDYYIAIDGQGKLWGIRDAYTFSRSYPYSTPYNGEPFKNGMNYIRNSVKVVVDPYNGDVNFYVFDDQDPVLRAWRNTFPGLFKPKEEMPKDLMAHIRYPEDFLSIQAQMYCTYHMTDAKTFFTKEDVWQIGKELYGPYQQQIIPYYVIIKLPGEQKEEEFIQMIPFTPQNRDNLIGWFAGRSDAPNYGKSLSFKFSKQKLIDGPMQFISRATEKGEIATTIALWSQQQGSDIIRGNTLIIPIADSLLYVEPIYLKSKQTEMPEIKKVIVSIGGKVVWGDNLEDALAKITGIAPTVAPSAETVQLGGDSIIVLQSADQHFVSYQKLTGEGRLAEAGEELAKLQQDLEKLQELTGQK